MVRKVAFLFTDYDGTLSPAEVPRSESSVPPPLESVLRRIARDSGLAVITAKDFQFIRDRVPYAWAWGCVSGLDLRFGDGSSVTFSCSTDVAGALRSARQAVGERALLEEKWGPSGLLGFSIDWRGSPEPPGLPFVASELASDGLFVSYYPRDPFADFYCAPPRKDVALNYIRAAAGRGGEAMFLGDSAADNPAFLAADISVAVAHGQPLEDLRCEYAVSSEDLPSFLQTLADGGMVFDSEMPGLRRK